jgi:NAD(P)-dependent dehydrogenase (short-subunit alcohol dehydrogenase family)
VAGAGEVVEAARRAGRRAVALTADLEDGVVTLGLVDRAAEALGGPLDVLVNSAAIFEPGGPLDTDLKAWERHLAIDLTAPVFLAQAFARQARSASGAIVNVLDWRATRPGPDHFAYTVAKAGLAAATRALAQALAPAVRVNGLALGAILPPRGGGPGLPDAARVPTGRAGTLEEAVGALLYLVAEGTYITGEILHVDGGRHLT